MFFIHTHSNVKDILEDLEVTVYNERKTGKNEFVGKVIIPLLRVSHWSHHLWKVKPSLLPSPAIIRI